MFQSLGACASFLFTRFMGFSLRGLLSSARLALVGVRLVGFLENTLG